MLPMVGERNDFLLHLSFPPRMTSEKIEIGNWELGMGIGIGIGNGKCYFSINPAIPAGFEIIKYPHMFPIKNAIRFYHISFLRSIPHE